MLEIYICTYMYTHTQFKIKKEKHSESRQAKAVVNRSRMQLDLYSVSNTKQMFKESHKPQGMCRWNTTEYSLSFESFKYHNFSFLLCLFFNLYSHNSNISLWFQRIISECVILYAILGLWFLHTLLHAYIEFHLPFEPSHSLIRPSCNFSH